MEEVRIYLHSYFLEKVSLFAFLLRRESKFLCILLSFHSRFFLKPDGKIRVVALEIMEDFLFNDANCIILALFHLEMRAE